MVNVIDGCVYYQQNLLFLIVLHNIRAKNEDRTHFCVARPRSP